MTAAESLTVSQLLSQIDAATSAAAAVIEGCTDDQWGTVVADENRTVGVVCHHIGYAYPFVVDWALQVARGEGAPAVSYDDVHALNHQHAEAQGTVDKEAALAQLHENTKSAREKLARPPRRCRARPRAARRASRARRSCGRRRARSGAAARRGG